MVVLARSADVSLFLALSAFSVLVLGFRPVPTFLQALALFVFWLAIQIGLNATLQKTLGEWIWGLGRNRKSRFPWGLNFRGNPNGSQSSENPLVRKIRLEPTRLLQAWFLQIGIWIACLAIFTWGTGRHASLLSAQSVMLPPFAPDNSAKTQAQWTVAPFFYLVGAWPTQYLQKPIFYQLPYEVGPPTRFVGRIIARWQMPEIRLTLEGPKTPVVKPTRDELKNCILNRAWSCPTLRWEVLNRHLQEMRAAGVQNWKLAWFEIQSAPGATEFPPAGILLTGTSDSCVEDRAILVSPSGIQQTLILRRSTATESQPALDLFVQTLRSLRMTESLDLSRTLSALRISEVALPSPKTPLESPELSAQIARAQAVLIARISAAPKDLDAYFHLAGSSLLLLRHAEALRKQLTGTQGPKGESVLLTLNDWTAAAKPVVQNVYKYAQDVDPKNPKTERIRDMWFEAQKYK